jgi:photosystem II stability/assembly factor-like uncharacterized protein
MERRDIPLKQIEQLANKRFEKNGTGRGTGYKHFQRWLREMQFQVDANGNFLPPGHDWKAYQQSKGNMQSAAQTNQLSSGNWTELGPTNWTTSTGGNPGVGRVRCFAIHPLDTTVIYVATEGGVWKSTNSGASWNSLTDDNGDRMLVFSIAIAPSNKNILYAGLGGTGVIKSTDAGNTWTGTATGPASITKKVLIHPANADLVFASSGSGIYRSADGGDSWTQVHDKSKEDIEFKPGNPDIMYASGFGDLPTNISPVWRSSDNGITWTPVDAAHGMQIDGRTQIAITPANPNIVYALQASGERFSRLYRSTNSGNTFAVVETGDPAAGHNYFSYDIAANDSSGIAHHAMAICGHPTNEHDVHLASVNIWNTSDGGKNFNINTYWHYPDNAPLGYVHADVHYLEYVGKTLYTTTDGGIFKSRDNGITWTDLSAGLGNAILYQISNSKTNANVYAAAAQDNGSIIHNNNGWVSWVGGDGVDCIVSHANENTAWGMVQFGHMVRTENGGQTATGLGRPAAGNFLSVMVQHPATASTLFAGLSGVYKSTDNGAFWTKISGNVIPSFVDVLAVAQTNPSYIYAAAGNKLYVTKNGGASWTTITAPLTISGVAISPLNPEKIWITSQTNTFVNKILASVNAGTAFTDISFNLPNILPRCITVDDNLKESVYVGMGVGVYYIDKTMSAWLDMTDNLPKAPVNDIEIQQSSGKLRVATLGRGVWEMPLFIPPCGNATGLQVSQVTYNSARLTWNAVAGVVNYTVQYKGLSDLFPINATATQNLINLANLRPGEFYTAKVMANCEGVSGNFSTSVTFITPPNPCAAPPGLVATPSYFSASLSWGAVSNVQYYEVRYKKTTDANFLVAATNLTSTSYVLTPLAMNTDYQVQVWAFCSVGSPNVSARIFKTLNLFGRTAASEMVEEEKTAPLGIAPNPVQDRLYILSAPDINRDAKVELVNMNGGVMLTVKHNNLKNGIDVSALKPGMYRLRIIEKGKSMGVSFVKL